MASTSCTPRTARRQSTARGFLPTSPLRGTTPGPGDHAPGVWHFYPRPPCGGRPTTPRHNGQPMQFLSTSPLRGTTLRLALVQRLHRISIHVPLAGDDTPVSSTTPDPASFLSTSPLRRTTKKRGRSRASCSTFLSTSPLRGTTAAAALTWRWTDISIHVPLRGTTAAAALTWRWTDISIHVPLAGDDAPSRKSTAVPGYFYPRPPCGGRRCPRRVGRPPQAISIHVPLAGDDARCRPVVVFVSISIHVPLAGDDDTSRVFGTGTHISIHVPLAGDDFIVKFPCQGLPDFYPRPPCGGRRRSGTPPMR